MRDLVHKHVEKIEGVVVSKLEKAVDSRGSLIKSRPLPLLSNNLDSVLFSVNPKAGVIRGLHFQLPPYGQEKLVTCLQGSVYDVAVDLRFDSDTYGCWMITNLSPESNIQIFLPIGVAHGFQTLLPNSIISYLVTNEYSPTDAISINPLGELGISWPVKEYEISEQDLKGIGFLSAAELYQNSLNKTRK